MNTEKKKQIIVFGWRTASSVLLLADYFLFSTGNPSLTYSFFGGWFIIPLAGAAIISISYWRLVYRKKENRRLFTSHLIIIVAVSIALFWMSGYARQHAIATLEADAKAFVDDPATSKVEASKETRTLMADIGKQPHTMRLDAFIPTFRRIDYLLTVQTNKRFTLILVKKWNGIPEISLVSQEP